MTKAVDIFEALDRNHIIVTSKDLNEGWFFVDTDADEDAINHGGDGLMYELPEDAAYAAAEYFGLLNEPEDDLITVNLTSTQLDEIINELIEVNNADRFAAADEFVDDDEAKELLEACEARSNLLAVLLAAQTKDVRKSK